MGPAAIGSGGGGLPSAGAAAGSPSGANNGSGGGGTSASGASVDSGASGSGGRRGSGSSGKGGARAADGDSGAADGGARDAGNSDAGGSAQPIDGGAHTGCKRGIATNTAPGAAFFPAISWWYNWSMGASGPDTGIEFVPMTWGKGDVAKSVPAGSNFLLTFNEPNFHAQSNLTPQEAASYWPMIEAKQQPLTFRSSARG